MSVPAFDEALVPSAVRALASVTGEKLAAFDADGCLWSGDVFEDFTQAMIADGHVPGALWPAYEEEVKRDPVAACFTMLRFFERMDHDALRGHVERFWATVPRPWNAPVLSTMHFLHRHGFTIYVVSGSATVVLSPLLRVLPVHKILGLEFEVDEGNKITGKHTGIGTAGPGKATAIKAHWTGALHFAVGNSIIDFDMLSLSQGVAWAFRPDDKLLAHATSRRWHITPR